MMKPKLRTLGPAAILAFACLILSANAAFAQPGRGGQRGSADNLWKFLAEKYDKNADGKLTQTEYDRGAEKFTRLDSNDDGVLTADDWSGARGQSANRGQRSGNRSAATAPQPGDQAPNFDLAYVNEPSKSVSLSSFTGKKPVALIFGSCT